MIEFLKPKSILDYGCGKGGLVKALAEKYPQIKIYGYDPAIKEFENLPIDKVDLVVNTDVLEHIPEDELPETIERISRLSKNVFFHLHHKKAIAVLENGENAHCTIWTPEQYNELFRKYFPTLTNLPGLKSHNSICLTFDLPKEIKDNFPTVKTPQAEVVSDLKAFLENMSKFKEIIVYSDGSRGKILLDYLQYTGKLSKVYCVTADGNFAPNVCDHSLPKIPLRNLVHFRDSALFIVATASNKVKDTLKLLTDFKCKNVVSFTLKQREEAEEALKNFAKDGTILTQNIADIIKKLDKLELVIEEQNELCAVNNAVFAKYRNAFRGRKVVIVASGPTVNYYKPMSDAIHIGINLSWSNENIPLDYLFSIDKGLNFKSRSVRIEEGFDLIKGQVFIGRRLDKIGGRTIDNYPVDISLRKNNVSTFYFESVPSDNCGQHIYQDICFHPLANFRSTVFAAMHFALFGYPKEIYLVGCDTDDAGYFYNPEAKNPLRLKEVKIGYARMKTFATHHYPETKIISVNPVGLKGLFKDVYTDEYKKFLKET